jgi:hypothetical protein
VTAEFPENVTATAQYGPVIQVAIEANLNVRQVIPCARTAEICEDLFNHRPNMALSSKPWANARSNSPRQWMKFAPL